MKRPSFDVLTEPWIPVIWKDASRNELGIQPCLERAHEIREIRHPSPIVEFGLYRILVAFMLDAFTWAEQRPELPEDLEEVIESGGFDADLIRRYLEDCGDVFDLFHPEKPFLQTKMDSEATKPIVAMYPAMPSGTNVGHWQHQAENEVEVSAQQAARWLVTIAPFMTAGGAGLSPSVNGAPGIYVLPRGASLFETIVMNLPLRIDQESGSGAVAWRSTRIPGGERTQATAIEALTWQPRRIQLVPEKDERGNTRVRRMKFEKGDRANLDWIDPNLAYRYGKEKRAPIRMREARPLWRDAGPLVLLQGTDYGRSERRVVFRRPDVVEQVFTSIAKHGQLAIHAYGMRTDLKKKVFEWVVARWDVPAKLGRSTRLGDLVHQELDRAEDAVYALRTQIRMLFPRDGAGRKEALRSITDRCERAYWQRLERELAPLMGAFAELDPVEAPDDPAVISETASEWRRTIERLALEQFESAAKDMDADSDALERLVRARTRLTDRLRRVISQ